MQLPEALRGLRQTSFAAASVALLTAILVGTMLLSLLSQAGFDLSFIKTISSATTTRAGRILETQYNPFAFLFLGAIIAAAVVLVCYAAAVALPVLSRITFGGANTDAAVSKIVSETRETLRDELEVVLEKLRAHIVSHEEYAKKLTGAQSQLNTITEPGQVQVVVKLLIDENERIRKETARLRDQLKTSDAEIEKLKDKLATAEEEGQTDPLTGTANRRAFDKIFNTAIEKASHSGMQFSVIMCDIDHFKKVNDTYGHATGDEVIKMFAKTLESSVRTGSVVARFGGEEFAVLLPGLDKATAAAVAERMRTTFAERKLTIRSSNKQVPKVTASFGVAQFTPGDTTETLLEHADANLYKAKQSGRNRVVS